MANHTSMQRFTLLISKTKRLDQQEWKPIKVQNGFAPGVRLQTQFTVPFWSKGAVRTFAAQHT